MTIKIKKINKNAKIPTRGSQFSAGFDLYALLESESISIKAHETVKIGTGLSFAIPQGWFGAIFARSGLATKEGLRPANCVGVVDSDYRGEIIIALHNDSDEIRIVKNGDRVAQMIIMPFLEADLEISESLPETVRGDCGFGSTGKQ